MKNLQEIKQKLESVFRRIEQEHMRDVPVCNPALQVEAVDFRVWGEFYLGVMITPWFMSLMLLPVRPDGDGNVQEGSKQVHVFPSGSYEFISGEFISGREADLGSYQVCSLFSPMHEFGEQQTAVDTAKMILVELMQARNRDGASTKSKTETTAIQNQDKKWDAPMSRRDFLRGGRSRKRERHREG
jgi:[NiFe] hydrogenase assembly HybE family chaperone